ncbi:MAG TPA: DUF5063 domain-containing protein [Labilithrix sp.]|nr:DUF5063 domain-containing protein [Labilithrix sp.]
MDRPAFAVRLRLLSAAEGGRLAPIRSNYRPSFDIGNTWQGEPTLNDGRILLTCNELAPGAEAPATVEPLRPQFWDHVRTGATLEVKEGARVVGYATVTEQLWPDTFTPAVAAFVRAAYDFCAFVETSDKLTLPDRIASAREQLLVLYAAGAKLPSVERVTSYQAPTYPIPERWPGFEDHDTYWEVYDPYQQEDPVAGSLADDVLDVYHDVRKGMWFWEKNEWADAVWEWRFSFDSHWGDHAVDALRALHRACARHRA